LIDNYKEVIQIGAHIPIAQGIVWC
jgi:hypothetical protein